jgi:hypothetical protein
MCLKTFENKSLRLHLLRFYTNFCRTPVKLRLEASRCNGVPTLCPLFSGLQTGSCSWPPACQISLNVLGETLSRLSSITSRRFAAH